MKYLKQSALLIASAVFLVSCFEKNRKETAKTETTSKKHWPNGARLVISVSMQFETGGQPEGAESPFSGTPLPKGQPDLAAESWYRYGANEGIYRMLDLWKKYDIKVTSHVVGTAAEKYPDIAKAIAAGGHEIAAHGISWDNQWDKNYADELLLFVICTVSLQLRPLFLFVVRCSL